MKFSNELVKDVIKFVALANANIVSDFDGDYAFKVNKAYIKVFSTNKQTGKPSSVWCFIDNEGNILKPASWASPAKNFARGNVNTIINHDKAVNIIERWRYGVTDPMTKSAHGLYDTEEVS